MRALIFSGLLISILMIWGACEPQGASQKKAISILRIGVLPELSEQELLVRYQFLFIYLAGETGIPYEFVPSSSYAELQDHFHNGRIDLAYFGGVTFVKAYKNDKAIPLVMRDIDSQFTSYFLVPAGSSVRKLEDLKGATFSFGSRFSTSGHFMPRYFMEQNGIHPEQFFKDIQYSGKHDTTAFWVQEGKVEAGVANSRIIKTLFENGLLKKRQTRILWETPPYSDYVWAVHPTMSDALQNNIRDAFLKLNPEIRQHRNILQSMGAGSFQPAHISDFSNLIPIRDELILSGKVH